jgi:hypothetical protein
MGTSPSVARGRWLRILARVVFAVAAVSALCASMGLAAPPHRVAPGTPLYHDLVLGRIATDSSGAGRDAAA